jgi:hypothetical protein
MPRGDRPSVEGVQDVQHASVEALAEALGRSRQTIHEWFKAGCPAEKPYSEVKVRLWAEAQGIEDLRDPAAPVAAMLGRATEPRFKPLNPVDEKKLELLELNIAKERRRLIAFEEIEPVLDAVLELCLGFLTELPDDVATALFPPAVDGEPPAPLTSSRVRAAVDQLVRAGRASACEGTRRQLRKLLGADAAAHLPPGAGLGGVEI